MLLNPLYSNEMSEHFHSLDWPKGFKCHIVEKSTLDTPWLQMIMFRDNLNYLETDERLRASQMVAEFIDKFRKQGVPIYPEIKKGDGNAETADLRLDRG